MKTTTRSIGVLSVAIAAALLVGMFGVSFAHAQTSASSSIQSSHPTVPACLTLSTDLSYGSTDARTAGQVTLLQQFLSTNGYFNASSIGTGQFGPITRAAVIKFQAAHMVPATGYVGPLTRAAIIHAQGSACAAPAQPSAAATITNVSPSKAAVGDTVTISGSNFSKSNTILLDGLVVARDVSVRTSGPRTCGGGELCTTNAIATDDSLSFVLPSSASPNCAPNMACPMFVRLISSGTYKLTVSPSAGATTTSNSLSFTVTGGVVDMPR